MEELNQLIQGCAANDRSSQEKLYKRFYPALFSLCQRFFADPHVALEVLNDGMLKVFRQISQQNSAKGSLFNWMYTIVRNTAIDRFRPQAAQATDHLHDGLRVFSTDNLMSSLESKDLYKLLDQLAPATRVVCALYYFEGFSVNEIASQLNLSAGTVKWHLSETRKKLKPVLQKYYS